MDEPNIYGNLSNEGRFKIEESDKEMGEPTEQEDGTERRRMDRRRRRAERRSVTCRCGRRSRSSRKQRRIASQNPFIIFYLEMYYKMPKAHVTEVARQAGKEWCALPEEQKKKYIIMAERERRRRRRRTGRRRRRGCPARS